MSGCTRSLANWLGSHARGAAARRGPHLRRHTDAGRSAEWAEFLDAIAPHPELAESMLILPGNHDLNIVDRANPARLDLPTSPNNGCASCGC